jgi:parallel beta-helix repeat protein
MKNIVALILLILFFPLNLLAADITYQVNSGGKASSLTNSYDMSAGSTARSDIDLTANPSISSHTNIHAVGEENNIEVTTSADDGSASSSASVRILDNVSSADISTSASAASSTSASVTATGTGAQAGLIKGESGGNKTFCAFTGDFNASSDAANGGVSASSTYEKALSNIYIVTKNPSPCHNPNYTTIQGGVDDTDTNGPNYVFVDYGNYAGAAMADKNSLTLMGVWGADNTIVDGSGGSGDTIAAANSTNLTIEGFTVTGGSGQSGDPISIYGGSDIRVRDNTVIGNDDNTSSKGINVVVPTGTVEITGNTVSNNKLAGINISFHEEKTGADNVHVSCNTVSNTGSETTEGGILVMTDAEDATVTATGNTVSNTSGGENSFGLLLMAAGEGATATATGNTVSNTSGGDGESYGVAVVAYGEASTNTATATGNTVSNTSGSGKVAGVFVKAYGPGSTNTATATGNTVSNTSGGDGESYGVAVVAYGEASTNTATATGNNVSNSGGHGIYASSSGGNATVTDNTVSNSGYSGINVASSSDSGAAGDATASDNTVSNSGQHGIFVLSHSHSGSAGNATASENTVSNSGEEGIYVQSTHGNVNIKGNTVTENLTGVTIGGTPTQAKVNENNIYSNTTTGLQNATSGPIDATNNWWGPGGTGGPGQGGNNDVSGANITTDPYAHVRF